MRTKETALLLPYDGSSIKIVSCDIKERADEDVNDWAAEFYDRIPDLRPWLGNAFQHRRMADFYVDSKERNDHDHVNRAFIKFDNSSSHGRYCLYYTLSSALQPNRIP